jgi:hypothetical protein
MKKEPSAWGYNRATLFLGDINTGTWPSMLWGPRIWDSKMWSWVPRDSALRVTELAKASSNSRRQIRPLVREAVTWGIFPQVLSWKKNVGRESQEAWCQDELIGDKSPVVKKLSLTLIISREKLVSEAGYSSGTKRKRNVRRWKPLPSND